MSDTHDDVEAIRTAVDFIKAQGYKNSRIVHAGDLSLRPYTRASLDRLRKSRDVGSFIDEKKAHNNQMLNEVKAIFDASGMPYTVTSGNYDGNDDLAAVFGDANLHLATTMFGDVKVAGYGSAGANPPHIGLLEQFGEITRFDDRELYRFLVKERPTIGIIHTPPQGMCDDMYDGQNVGTPATTKYLSENPGMKLVISGHIHEAGPNGNNPHGVKGVRAMKHANGELSIVVNPGNLGRFEIVNPNTLDPGRQFDYGTFISVDVDDTGKPSDIVQYSLQTNDHSVGQIRKIGHYRF
jgi:Icc-related predicted phosphoesterase